MANQRVKDPVTNEECLDALRANGQKEKSARQVTDLINLARQSGIDREQVTKGSVQSCLSVMVSGLTPRVKVRTDVSPHLYSVIEETVKPNHPTPDPGDQNMSNPNPTPPTPPTHPVPPAPPIPPTPPAPDQAQQLRQQIWGEQGDGFIPQERKTWDELLLMDPQALQAWLAHVKQRKVALAEQRQKKRQEEIKTAVEAQTRDLLAENANLKPKADLLDNLIKVMPNLSVATLTELQKRSEPAGKPSEWATLPNLLPAKLKSKVKTPTELVTLLEKSRKQQKKNATTIKRLWWALGLVIAIVVAGGGYAYWNGNPNLLSDESSELESKGSSPDAAEEDSDLEAHRRRMKSQQQNEDE